MNKDMIIIEGARTHNLKNISLSVPKNKLVVFTGISGSGKSSLVFDTIYTEAQRQLIETFSSFARRRLPKLSRPPVDEIRNISTAILIDQKRLGRNLRSTVGTATELSTYLRMLYSRFGKPFIGPSFYFSFNHPEGMCPECKGLGKRITVDVNLLLDKSKTLREGAVTHPDYKVEGWNWREIIACKLFDPDKPLINYTHEELERLLYAENIPIIREHGAGIYRKAFEGIIRKLERSYIDKSEDELPEARKDAYQRYFLYLDCTRCSGSRLNERAKSILINEQNIACLSDMELTDLDTFLCKLQIEPASSVINKMRSILNHLISIDVGYLSLNRSVSTLSGGESQRVKMARQLDCDLVDMMYILDEPSIGLHPKDNEQLICMLKQLRDKGNSTLIVEHDNEVMKHGDWIIDIGPDSGINGGNIVFEGTYEGLLQSDTTTGKYLRTQDKQSINRKQWNEYYTISNASVHNLKNITVKIPKSILTCITGVAGSGKSSLIHEEFLKSLPDAIVIDQTPAGKTSRSTPVSYIGAFDLIRKEISEATNSNASNFSFNSHGACEKCKGQGFVSIEMNFLDDVRMICDECNGKRYKDEVLEIKYKNKNIFEILNMKVTEAIDFFEHKEIKKRLVVLAQVGLDYLDIGQPLSSLSGGEAQRIKIAAELHKKGNVYVMDEPSIGLHMADIEKLIKIIKTLTSHNNTVVIIEHNLDLIKQADWIIDMGPGGGKKGGEIIAEGTPEDIALNSHSITGKYLKPLLAI
jgi:excinuclease UvrABC ATPase subunit